MKRDHPEPGTVVDASDRSAAGFGVTRELGVLTPYALLQAWADAFAAKGFSGLRYWLRFDPGPGRGIALFGRQGLRDDWPVGDATPATAWRAALEQQAGVTVLDIPALHELSLRSEGWSGRRSRRFLSSVSGSDYSSPDRSQFSWPRSCS